MASDRGPPVGGFACCGAPAASPFDELRRENHGTAVPVRLFYTRLADGDGAGSGFATMAHALPR